MYLAAGDTGLYTFGSTGGRSSDCSQFELAAAGASAWVAVAVVDEDELLVTRAFHIAVVLLVLCDIFRC